jgi:hypothetical protein
MEAEQITELSPTPDIWHDDKMDRKVYADFLTNYIDSRITSTGKPLTAALDASWGTGKTFFVERWAKQIESTGGAAIIFDSWKNDFATDPLLSFMAELVKGMKKLEERCPSLARSQKTLIEHTNGLITSFRKAAMPAATTVIKSVITKYAGDVFKDLADGGELTAFEDKEWEDISSDLGKSLEKGLEVLFKKSLEDHHNRTKASEGFRRALEALVKMLQKEEAINGPLFIFIDELDRCRPDYSIKLLEGIKHLFAVPGVAFVISTNLEQLSKSVQGVYGPSFNGFSYLKRFFDFEFTLPDPDNYSFAQLLSDEQPIFQNRIIVSGLLDNRYENDNLVARSFEQIATAMRIPLRDQRQVWTIAAAACSGIPQHCQVHVLWLFFLAAARHLNPDAFTEISNYKSSENCNIQTYEKTGISPNHNIKSVKYNDSRTSFHTRAENIEINLISILESYRASAQMNTSDISNKYNRDEYTSNYPDALIINMLNHQNTTNTNPNFPYTKLYPRLIKMAGLIE